MRGICACLASLYRPVLLLHIPISPPSPPKYTHPPPSSTQESTATFAPVVQLEEVDVKSGEEDEEIIFSIKAKVRHWLSRHL